MSCACESGSWKAEVARAFRHFSVGNLWRRKSEGGLVYICKIIIDTTGVAENDVSQLRGIGVTIELKIRGFLD